jgi:tripartite-type tricarboxylate transporter receptor subunit TctC
VIGKRLPYGHRCCGVAMIAAAIVPAAYAQNYPLKPVRFVSPFPAGGVNDIIARVIAQRMSEALGQQWVVENRPGAGGNLGTDYVAKAAPDGYTLLNGGMGSLTVNPFTGKVPYDSLRDFTPIILMARAPNVVTAHPSLPAISIAQLIALARSRPGQLKYASGGVGSTPHLSGALFASMAHIRIVHIPYKGGALATVDLLAGQVELSFLGIPSSLSFIRDGKLRGLAVTGIQRSPELPGVPTVNEAGLPGYEVNPWYGVLAPAGAPRDIVARLNAEVARIVRVPEVSKQFAAQGVEAAVSTPEEFAAIIRADFAKWSKVIREIGIREE